MSGTQVMPYRFKALSLARKMHTGQYKRMATMNEVRSSIEAFKILKQNLHPHAEEVWIIALSSQLEIVGHEMIFRGTADRCVVHPRDIFRFLIQKNACSFIIAHNHPSNSVLPSEQDLSFTKKLRELADLCEITLTDHVIFCADKYYSMADHGHFKKWRRRSW
jgi:DNA repair protein RadC